MSDVLPVGPNYDIKLINSNSGSIDYVNNVLLNCRSLQLCGNSFSPQSIAADKRFAWEHWLKYSPHLIPSSISCNNPKSVVYFKILCRCFGVLSFLKYKAFTRDITTCIDLAYLESRLIGTLIDKMRSSLESCDKVSVDIRPLKDLLRERFDDYFLTW